MQRLKFHSEDNGFCRVYYTYGLHLYCYQLETSDPVSFTLFKCTNEGEPSHSIKPLIEFPPCPGNTSIGIQFNQWLKEKDDEKG